MLLLDLQFFQVVLILVYLNQIFYLIHLSIQVTSSLSSLFILPLHKGMVQMCKLH